MIEASRKLLDFGNFEKRKWIMATPIMDEEFNRHADEALSTLRQMLVLAADDYGFSVGSDQGTLSIETPRPRTKFVITLHSAARQVWISARAKKYKLDWDIVENTFVLEETGQTLKEVMEEIIGRQIGEDVSL